MKDLLKTVKDRRLLKSDYKLYYYMIDLLSKN
jgi:hypothetical protein